jgi:hypothetical protein
MINAYISANKPQRTPCGRYKRKRWIILKWILKKQDVRIWTNSIDSCGSQQMVFFEHNNETSNAIKPGN